MVFMNILRFNLGIFNLQVHCNFNVNLEGIRIEGFNYDVLEGILNFVLMIAF
jgi:hypothetical protein